MACASRWPIAVCGVSPSPYRSQWTPEGEAVQVQRLPNPSLQPRAMYFLGTATSSRIARFG